VLIGERPGLSSPDIVGAQLSLQPTVGRTDAQRNCVSNSHPQGLAAADAARRSTWLLRESMCRQLMGVALKDDGEALFMQGLQELLQRRGLRLR
jgi:ethanolamine ammonia-lyase small subunit